jgi:SAM-dependent methyltransferase
MKDCIPKDLIELGVVDPAHVVPYFPRVRDREDIAVLRDQQSGVIFLNRQDHMDISHYEEVEGGAYWQAESRADALIKYREDDARRAVQFAGLVAGKEYVDVGCGTGGVLDELRSVAHSVAGVEPQKAMRDELAALGYPMYRLSEDLPKNSFDVASLFHTLEHVIHPLQILREVHTALRPGGTVVVEVPHAGDALLASYDCEAFKKFTFWSEHLVLHTHDSLTTFLKSAGFNNVRIEGFQRYPLANHMWWLAKGEPGGQHKLPQLRNPELEQAYANTLAELHQTDTLIAYATK